MRRLLLLPLVVLTACGSSAADELAATPAVPVAATAATSAPASDEPKTVEADAYWSGQRLRALEDAKRKFKAPVKKDAPEGAVAAPVLDVGADAAVADTVVANVPPAPPVAEPVPFIEPAPVVQTPVDTAPVVVPSPEPLPVPSTEVVWDETVSDKDLVTFLQGLVIAVDLDLITVEGLAVALDELAKLELTPKQRRIIDDMIVEVDRIISSGPARDRDERWNLIEIDLPRQVRKGLRDKAMAAVGKGR